MKSIKISIKLFWLVAFLQVNSAIGQSSYDLYLELTGSYKDLELQLKADSLLEVSERSGDLVSMVEIAHRQAIMHAIVYDFVNAIRYGHIEVSVFDEKNITEDHYKDIVPSQILEQGYTLDSMRVRALYNLGRFYIDNSEYENAIEIFERIIEIDCTPLRTGQAYAEIAKCNNKMGDFFNAIHFYQRGIGILEAEREYVIVANQSVNMAATYRNIDNAESLAEGQRALEKADSLHKIYPLEPKNYRGLINDLANQYISESTYDFQKAQGYYVQGLELGLEKSDSITIAMSLNNLANLYNLERNDSALYYIERGFAFVSAIETKARLFDNKSDYYLLMEKPDQSLIYIHRALETILGLRIDPLTVPDGATLSDSDFKDLTIFFLKKKTEVLNRLFKQTGKRDFLEQAILNVKAADKLIDIIQSGSYENETKLLWRKEASEIYIKGVHAARLLDQPKELFYFIEKNKALLLSEEIAINTTYASLPRNISDRAIALKKIILELENSGSENTQSTDPKASRNFLFNAKQQYENYIDSVRQVFPAYFKRKVSIDPIPITQWQKSLKPNTAFISYIWNNLNAETEALIGLAVSRDKAHSFTITGTDALKSLISEYQQLVSRPLKTRAEQAQFFKVSSSLFNQLIPDVKVKEMVSSKTLIIVPDGPLQGIPFEALVTNSDNQLFLMETTDVSYLYSVSFQYHNERVQRKTSQNFLAYAPVNFDKTGLEPLKKTFDELRAIEEQIGGSLRFEDDATKSDFLSESNSYRIIHLATHANANENPWIAFSDDKVNLHELYTYHNNAELVTLSACNTLLGEVASGEGVLSLSRGFFYSGAKSVVASLWNIDDQSTSIIMADFYTNLKAGQGKSEALNNAKRNYLKTHTLSEQSPYYWSSFVLIGDDAPIDFSTKNNHWYLIAALLVILLVFIFMKKKQQM